MQVPSPTTADLMAIAESRGRRFDDLGSPAWIYPGENKTVLFVHGFRGDHHGLSAIAAALPDHEVVIPDLPGYGKAMPLAVEHSLENYGAWLVAFASKLSRPFSVLGHSFGSLVVASALTQGLNPDSVILLNPITKRQSDSAAGRFASAFYKMGKLPLVGSYLLRSWLSVQVMSSAMATSRSRKLRRLIHDQHHRFFSNYFSDQVVQEGFIAASTGSVEDFAHYLNPSTLLICGSKDSLAPLAGAISISNQTGAQLRTLPVGHLTHYESPNEVASLVREFLKDR